MKLNILSNRAEIIEKAVQVLIDTINQHSKPYFVLGLSTGATVLSICEILAKEVQNKKVSLHNVIVFYAGEFIGFSQYSRQYYFQRLQNDFFSKVDLQAQNIHTFNGNAEDLELECESYEQKINKLGGMDFFLGSLGEAGELAFNEPGSSLRSRTRLKTLTSETIKADARFFQNDPSKVPTQALTMGVATIFEAKEVLIVVYGVRKAFAVRACLEEAISEMHPASILQMHPNTSFFVDKVSGRLLTSILIDKN
ncbi:MAG: glucosamine-6-phosphate deaminase [Brevinema sp.]